MKRNVLQWPITDLPSSTHSEPSNDYFTTSLLVPESTTAPLLKRNIGGSESELEEAGESKEGLYCRTKRQLGLKGKKTPKQPVYRDESRAFSATGDALDLASSLLRDFTEKQARPLSTTSSLSNLSIAGHSKRFFSRSRHSVVSTSSSIREVMMGKPPVASPDPETWYTGSDGQKYFYVDMGARDAPSCLPSEAQRIGTPPLRESSISGRKHRGFFFDYIPPGSEEFLVMKETQRSLSPSFPTDVIETEKDWFRLSSHDPLEPGKTPTEEIEAPEHLPSSPLCPKNRRHPSGGKGICPSHGRIRKPAEDHLSVR
ncbi:hypothetical protein MMC09_006644 [Bachmanniomyces sp. S44760]|nr:hypothetical protein [Bachmanniomyces sp. S44760]